jgi:rod shape-determining protein MreC
LKPSANLQHLDEVLVVTETSDQLPVAAKRDLAKSEAAGAEEVEMQRASDILAEKLPGLEDPNAPKSDDDSKANAFDLQPLKPLTAARPDRFSPSEVRPASQMTPGKAAVIPPPDRTSTLTNDRAQPAKHAKKPAANPDAVPDGAPHTNQESFIIPGTATGPDRPLVNPEKTASVKTGTAMTAGAGAPVVPVAPAKEQPQ